MRVYDYSVYGYVVGLIYERESVRQTFLALINYSLPLSTEVTNSRSVHAMTEIYCIGYAYETETKRQRLYRYVYSCQATANRVVNMTVGVTSIEVAENFQRLFGTNRKKKRFWSANKFCPVVKF